MTLLPGSMLWRTFALLAALVVASSAAWFAIFRAYEVEPRARGIAQGLASVVNLTRTALVTARADRRRDLLQDLAEREGIEVWPAESGEALVAPVDSGLLRLVGEQLRAQLGKDTRLAASRDGREGLWISFRIEDDEYWVRVPRERLERRIAMRWLVWAASALALALLAAYVIVRRVNRPLRALSAAAERIGRGERPEPLAESGAAELRSLSRAFNRMSSDLARLDQDRALILAGVSHDLRTPLARLRLAIELSGGDDASRAGMHADIEEMDRIVGQFLDFARTDGGEAPQPSRLSGIAEELAAHHARLGHAVRSDCRETPQIPLRREAMRRALANLVDNALRHGGGAVELATREEAGDSLAEISDRGPGIPAGETERLKRPFTRLEEARSGAGAGLGLAIVDRIVRAHGGQFELIERAGGGLTARIRIPPAGAQATAVMPPSR